MEKKITEKQIENAILDFLALLPNSVFWKNNNTGVFDPIRKSFRKTSRHHRNGCSDILGVLLDGNTGIGKFVAIEVKTKTGRVSKNQKQFLEDVRNCGGIAFVARSVDEVREILIGCASS